MNIPRNQVILHCLHQHDAPFVNIEAAKYLGVELDWGWFDVVKNNVKNAALALFDKLQIVSEIGWSETRVHGYASNRRVPMKDGSIAVRYSRCGSPEVKAKPVGLIDPMLRTLAFFGKDGSMLTAWSFYATHPQVANDGKRFSADAPGETMILLKERSPGVVNTLFNGCFGNLTAGKYTSLDDLEGNIKHFGKILADAITMNLQSMHKVKAENFSWQREVFEFPLRQFSEEELQNRSKTVQAALRAGCEYGKKYGEEYGIELLQIGDVKILFLNGHGGNSDMLGMFTRGMMQENPNVMLFRCGTSGGEKSHDVYANIAADYTIDYLTEEDREALRDFVAKKKKGGHGCLMETAWLYHYAPETVRIDRIADESGLSVHRFDEFSKHKISTHFAWMGDYPNSYGASNDYVINERIARAITEYYENLLVDKLTFLKNETISDEYHAEWLAKQ